MIEAVGGTARAKVAGLIARGACEREGCYFWRQWDGPMDLSAPAAHCNLVTVAADYVFML